MKIFGTGLFFAFLLTGCMNAVSRQEIVKNFYLMTVDVEEQSSLTYGDEKDGGNYGIVIGPAVFAVGYNDRFIIAKQHPWVAGKAVNKAVTNYYILPVGEGMNWQTKNGLMGPLTLEQFNGKMKELNIGGKISFTKMIHDLE